MIATAVGVLLTMTATVSGSVSMSLADYIQPVTAPPGIVEEVIEEELVVQEEAPIPADIMEYESSEVYAGTYRITYYCQCSTCNGGWSGTASGEPLTPGYTVACPDFPFGTTLLIDGVGYRCVLDTGVGSGCIDVCVSSHEEALALGMHYSDVWIVR